VELRLQPLFVEEMASALESNGIWPEFFQPERGSETVLLVCAEPRETTPLLFRHLDSKLLAFPSNACPYESHQGCIPPWQHLRDPSLCRYLSKGFPGAAESVEPSRAATMSVACSRFAALGRYGMSDNIDDWLLNFCSYKNTEPLYIQMRSAIPRDLVSPSGYPSSVGASHPRRRLSSSVGTTYLRRTESGRPNLTWQVPDTFLPGPYPNVRPVEISV